MIRLIQRKKYQTGVFLCFFCLVAQNRTTEKSRWFESCGHWFFHWYKDDVLLPWYACTWVLFGRVFSQSADICFLYKRAHISLQPAPTVVQGKEPEVLTSGSCTAASQERMGHVWGSTPLKEKNISSDVQQDRETSEISSSVITVFLYVFLTLSHVFGRTLEADQVALRIWNTSQACAFNSPDRLYAPWAPLRAVLCNAVTQSKCWDCNAPAAPLSWVFSTLGFFHNHLHLAWARFRRFHSPLIAMHLLNSSALAV